MPKKKAKLPLSKTHPKLAKEAHGWNPLNVTAGSKKKVSWKCSKDHQYESRISHRTNGSGCPYCNNNRFKLGFNDLLTCYPDIAKEAYGWDTALVGKSSMKKYKWICKKKHVYESSVSNRTGQSKSGCPYCSGAKVLSGFNDLAITHPKLAKEAYGWDPKTVGKGSVTKLEWICSKKHIFISTPNSRTRVRKLELKSKSGGTNCPFCANQKVLTGFNDLATTHSKLAKEAYGWDPKLIVAGNSKKLGWICVKKHIWFANVNSRSRMNLGCPICSNKQVLVGLNDLKSTFPKVAAEADGWDPSQFVAKSGARKQWKCKENHSWITSIYSRTARNWGCPYCSNQRLLVGFNDLGTTHPKVAKQASGWDPKTVTAGDAHKNKWICDQGHEYYSTVRDRAGRGTECVYCVGTKVLQGYNDLATTHPKLAKEAYGWDPKTYSFGSNAKLDWRCEKGHQWNGIVTNRTRENSGCPICKNKTLLTGFNDLATTHPEIAKQAVGWDPSRVAFGSSKKLAWMCDIGHEWKSVVVSRTAGSHSGCPICANKVVLVGFNDLATTFPMIASEMVNGDPKKVTAGSGKMFKWKCELGHTWTTQVASRTFGRGCPSCASAGFDPNIDSWLYLIRNEKFEMLQIGISNYPKDRLKVHERNGWELIDLRGPMQGDIAYAWEQSMMKMLNKNGANLGDAAIDGNFDGFTEAWSKSTFPVKSIKELMRLTEEYEENK